jgi:hypothetical protein
MNVSSGPTKLIGALKKMRISWSEIEGHWKDAVREEFERQYLAPLEELIEVTAREMNRLGEIFAKAEMDCR